jgi:hypothetical protein
LRIALEHPRKLIAEAVASHRAQDFNARRHRRIEPGTFLPVQFVSGGGEIHGACMRGKGHGTGLPVTGTSVKVR